MNFKMVLFIAALVIIGTTTLWGQKPTEEDPYLLWQTKDPEGYESFLVHPNGNIIAMNGLRISELNGNTGEVIRVFNIKAPVGDISPDGKYLLILTDSVTIIDYETEAIVKKLGVPGAYPNLRFFPDGKRIIYHHQKASVPGFDSLLVVYDLIKDKYTYLDLNYFPRAIATSPDGRYFATGGTGKEQVGIEEKEYTYLTLWDAQTLKLIKQLDKIEGDNEVRSIKFSPDGKYVGFNGGFYDIKIFNTESFNFIKNYSGAGSFCLFSNNLVGMYANPGILINDYLINQKLFETANISGGAFYFVEHNTKNNSLVYGGGILRALDLNKILTSVPELPEKNHFTVQYKKRTLILTDFNSLSGQINITLSDISGRVIRKLDSPVSGSELRIPLILPNGTYLLHIQDGNKEYSSKFLVTE